MALKAEIKGKPSGDVIGTLNTAVADAFVTEFREEILWSSWFLFRGQFLKARIVPELIPDRIEPQQRRSNRIAVRYLQQPLENGNRVVGIPQLSVDARHVLLFPGALPWVFGSGIHGHSFLSFGDGRGRFAQTCMGQTQSGMQSRLGRRTRRGLLELALKILRRFFVSRARRGDIA